MREEERTKGDRGGFYIRRFLSFFSFWISICRHNHTTHRHTYIPYIASSSFAIYYFILFFPGCLRSLDIVQFVCNLTVCKVSCIP